MTACAYCSIKLNKVRIRKGKRCLRELYKIARPASNILALERDEQTDYNVQQRDEPSGYCSCNAIIY